MSILSTIAGLAIKNAPAILTGVGVVGVVATTVEAVRATPKAAQAIEKAKKIQPRVTRVDVVKLTWKYYVPTLLIGGATIAAIVCMNSVHTRRTQAIALAYTALETASRKYAESVTETVTSKKADEIKDKLASKLVQNNPVPEDKSLVIVGSGKELMYDSLSGRYFMGSVEEIRGAENQVNKDILSSMGGAILLNEFYSYIGLPGITLGDRMGWDLDNLVSIYFSSQVTDDGRAAIVILYDRVPLSFFTR